MSKKKRRDIPLFNQPIIETHFHLDYLEHRATNEILEAAHQVGVKKFISIGVSPDKLPKVLELAQTNPSVYAALGVHPHEAKHYNQEAQGFIEQHLGDEKVVALGEIGLDYYYNLSEKEQQISVFERQLELAAKADIPIIVHTREADADTQRILEQYAPKLKRKGVIHSFTSSLELARCALDLGFYIGINGIVTFNKAENVHEIAKLVPLNRLVLETDSPYLTPAPYRGKDNEPMYLPFIAEKIAQLKQIEVEEVLKQAYTNSLNLFFASEHEQA